MNAHSFQPVKSKYLVLTMDYLLPIFITILVLIGIWLVLFSPFFVVKTIECQQDFQPCENESIIAELNKSLGSNLFRLNLKSIKNILTSGDFTIKTAVISRLFPSTLFVDLQSVYPTVALQLVSNSTEWIILDQNYRVIGKRILDPNVPTVLVSSLPSYHVGQVIDDTILLSTFKLAHVLSDEFSNVKTIELTGDTIKLKLSDNRLALLSSTKDQLTQIRTLQAILADSTISSEVETFDVRFSQPILR